MKPEKQLYQWDTNQSLVELTPSAQFVDYPIGDEVIRIKADGTRCRIPDEVLQTYGGKTCYERYPDGTFRAYSFSVLYAPKPPDYVYTPEERTTFEALTARVDAAIEEIKRRADSGEFTPKKGVDYFTEAEKDELMESVSSGAVGEFRKVVDTATTAYNANAAEKLTAYNANAEQQTTDYNRNAAEKLEAYNSNHTEKVAEYNQNAETKTAEFDANAAALQTDVDRLRRECDTLAAENRKQKNRISALMKLNKGQTYDVLEQENEAYSVDVPSGARYVGIDKVGGTSVVWNQHLESYTYTSASVSIDGDVVTITPNDSLNRYIAKEGNDYVLVIQNHVYLQSVVIKSDGEHSAGFQNYKYLVCNNKTTSATWTVLTQISKASSSGKSLVQLFSFDSTEYQIKKDSFNLFDLTQMFGSTIADYIYSLEQSQAGAGVAWFKNMFPNDYYPYCEPTIISSQTDRVDVASSDGTVTQQITTSFPVLNSAGNVYDYIDLNELKLHQRVGVVDLGTFNWNTFPYGAAKTFRSYDYTGKKPSGSTFVANIICSDYESISANDLYSFNKDKAIAVHNGSVGLMINDSKYTDATAFKSAMNGVMLYYELAEEVITDIDIPTEFTEWLQVEPGGTVTFRNADDSKQLAVPNAVSWVRKLNEVE